MKKIVPFLSGKTLFKYINITERDPFMNFSEQSEIHLAERDPKTDLVFFCVYMVRSRSTDPKILIFENFDRISFRSKNIMHIYSFSSTIWRLAATKSPPVYRVSFIRTRYIRAGNAGYLRRLISWSFEYSRYAYGCEFLSLQTIVYGYILISFGEYRIQDWNPNVLGSLGLIQCPLI